MSVKRGSRGAVATAAGHGDAALAVTLGEGEAVSFSGPADTLALGEGSTFVALDVDSGPGVGRAVCTWAARATMTGVPSGRLGTETSIQVASR